jgi:hypothetical protein
VAENTAKKQRGRPFKPGQSGNPKGKPKGALNLTTRAAQELLDGEAQALTQKAVELAKGGNVVALRLCLERTVPTRRERSISIELPQVYGAADILKVMSAILGAVGTGEITPSEGRELTAILENYRKGIEMAEIWVRLEALEGVLKGRKKQ